MYELSGLEWYCVKSIAILLKLGSVHSLFKRVQVHRGFARTGSLLDLRV